jgi:DNA-binding transcriptional MerR regulator
MTVTIKDLFALQGDDETITPAEVERSLRGRGFKLSRRTIGFYQEQGLLPSALRVGSRGGVYPQAVVTLAEWVLAGRERGVRVEVLVQLLPIWRLLVFGGRNHEIDLAQLELVARSSGLSSEANYHVPWVLEQALGGLCADCLSEIKWQLKDGTIESHTPDSNLTLQFVLGEVTPETGRPRVVAWTQLTLPGFALEPDLGDPRLVVLGLPVGMTFDDSVCVRRPRRPHVKARTDRSKSRSQEDVLL